MWDCTNWIDYPVRSLFYLPSVLTWDSKARKECPRDFFRDRGSKNLIWCLWILKSICHLLAFPSPGSVKIELHFHSLIGLENIGRLDFEDPYEFHRLGRLSLPLSVEGGWGCQRFFSVSELRPTLISELGLKWNCTPTCRRHLLHSIRTVSALKEIYLRSVYQQISVAILSANYLVHYDVPISERRDVTLHI